MTIHSGYRQQVRLNINGIVQGVGFRPFVYRLATQSNLVGSVLNNQQGVCIHLQGLNTDINKVVHQLKVNPPPLARIDKLLIKEEAIDSSLQHFVIETSTSSDDAVVSISADKSVCGDCLLEMRDPKNRHYQYPFTNCTNCGPRYSIINNLPYDRINTSMANFVMCDECAYAYNDPLNRRYHAQPVSCPKCGPQLNYIDCTANSNSFSALTNQQIISKIVSELNNGKVIAIKGLGGFHIICDATNDIAVKRLRQRKHRKAKPLAVMATDLPNARQMVEGTNKEWQILSSAENPITLMKKRSDMENNLSPALAPDIDTLGIFLPYTPLHHLLVEAFRKPLVATSANISGLPIITDGNEIKQKLGEVVDGIVDHNRPIVNACDDSVVQVIDDKIQVIRLARGYAPLSIPLSNKLQHHLLAVGAQQKNTQCFAFNENAFVSPHIGDLHNLETNQYFEQTINTFRRLYQFTPEQIIADKHPKYTSSQWAKSQANEQKLPLANVQHHYAHVLSVLAANNYHKQVLAFSFDGTGLGDDNQLWGSECMLADAHNFEVKAHFRSFKLIGGEQAIKQPVRILLALLFDTMSVDEIMTLPINAIQQMDKSTVNNLHNMWLNNSACIECRSVGRIFDAVAVALNLIIENDFEAQAGMLISTHANMAIETELYNDANNLISAPSTSGKLSIISNEDLINDVTPLTSTNTNTNIETKSIQIFEPSQLIYQLITRLKNTKSSNDLPGVTNQLCLEFIESLSQVVCYMAKLYPSYKLILCGGVFQNKLLYEMTLQHLNRHFNYSLDKVLPSKLVPINDAGISLGQIWYAYQQLNKSQTQH
ncbi:carbamoyltransferase HypF [Shewanella sp. 1_MG-2023]|uniref:carbamoyltransferase HypF n=1 Tax=unclassified Shewanella TaxID=196818 RepID=UPI0026E1B102|nr:MULTISPECIES: carbamoyltransferase HypF [unclassified Shewanella]MDO6612882.1 carbamoyltransferase HypF [Shewanella sp. 7_MG-2023]MDO6772588.1 carbamoyltransferase HypF [Shewanella sp. 2_MG-2023]MDO6795208.1 carbamoyltransferase HypF [Shewanella sp. 1_MG-2023]